ncbi:unnamed protein product [Linum tenue]|uniref:3-ketoacyl-CoA synthase n=1 Tax=Linum tenue TaxID=586396 RepID=A0AAV0GR62_9ROSI|nr:unnamed protein product [Linum tenue]
MGTIMLLLFSDWSLIDPVTTITETAEASSIILIHFIEAGAALLLLGFLYLAFRSNSTSSVYLIDYTCYRPPDHLRAPIPNFTEHIERTEGFSRENRDFQQKVLHRSGIGDEACMPISVHELPPNTSFEPSQQEVEQVVFQVVKDLLSKHRINPKGIDILISNCSIFCPTPSITSMIINRFGLRSNVKSISLSGMGCSAGLLSISMIEELFKVHKNSLALVLSMEAVTPNGYRGRTKSMLVANTIFRMGGAAILLSNKKHDKWRANYELQHLVRTHMGADEQSYRSVVQKPDEEDVVGVSLSKSLLQVAARALKINVSELGPLVLPYSEQLKYGWLVTCQKLCGKGRAKREAAVVVPRFKRAFEHFCIHAGGRAIIDGVEKNLKLENEDGEASRMTLYRFGNTSSSSVWYELSYLEAKGKVKKGDRIWQISFGSGFKCNSAVWKSLANVDPERKNAWSERIHMYPVQMPDFS